MTTTWEYECNRCSYKMRAEGLRLALALAIDHQADAHPPLTIEAIVAILAVLSRKWRESR